MDVDALTAARRAEWDRLDQIRREGRVSGRDADELVARYRSASADLADIKTSAGRVAQGDVISSLLAAARLRMGAPNESPLRSVPRFFVWHLPAALYRVRWTTAAVAAVFLVVAVSVAVWISSDPALVATLGSEADLESYANDDFVSYYNPAAVFAGTVWINNFWIALQCVLFGVTGFWPVMVVVQNAVGVGTAAAVLLAHDAGDVFVLYILPHGLLELTCVFVAAAAGLHLFWAMVAPGAQTRTTALARAGLSLVTVAIGLVLALAVSGLIEGFVTGQPWPWPVKIGIGALALVAFLSYMWIAGARAARHGETGELPEDEAGITRLAAG